MLMNFGNGGVNIQKSIFQELLNVLSISSLQCVIMTCMAIEKSFHLRF